jgi:hypothetical protein
MNQWRWDRIRPEFQYSRTADIPSTARRHHVHELPPAERSSNFEEAVTGLEIFEAREEADRCLRCDIREGH